MPGLTSSKRDRVRVAAPAVVRAATLAAALAVTAGCGGAPRAGNAELPPNRAVAYAAFLEGQDLAALGDDEGAADALRRAIRADPASPTLPLYLARLLAGMPDQLDDGLAACDRAEALDADPSAVALARARLLVANGELAAASDVLGAAAEATKDPAVFEVWVAAADTPEERRRAAQAYADAKPDSPAAWRALGDALVDLDTPELRAAATAFAAAAAAPDGAGEDAYRELAALAALDDPEALSEAAGRCVDMFRGYWPCWSWRVIAEDLAGPHADGDPALQPTTDALRDLAIRVVDDTRATVGAGAELRRFGRVELVAAFGDAVADLRSNDVEALTNAAWIAIGAGQEDVAVARMLRVIELDDANYDALNFVGYTWAEAGTNLEEAEAHIRRALFIRGEDGNILDSLGWVLFRQGRLDEAIEIQRRAVVLEDTSAVIWDHLGDMLDAAGHLDEAITAWQTALLFAEGGDEDVLETTPAKVEAARERRALGTQTPTR
ncbi:MAG: hypothetical protein H6698_05785 [Myxococcales bacterium]|nr:hypothetical protein [Myxococcales bacterium]